MGFSNGNICHDKSTHLLGVLLENEKCEVLKARIQIALSWATFRHFADKIVARWLMIAVEVSCLIALYRFSFYLTNRFQVAVCLFSNRSQMTSKCIRWINSLLFNKLYLTYNPVEY